MKSLRVLRKNSGFTLVECIIAIVVFAAMTAIVLMIMSFTVDVSKKASKAEKNLDSVVKNVVGDSSIKNNRFGEDAYDKSNPSSPVLNQLNMKFGTEDFSMTYVASSGVKGYLCCAKCGEVHPYEDYLGYIYGTSFYSTQTDKSLPPTHYFSNAATDTQRNYYLCPSCDKQFTAADITMKCLTCEHTGTGDTFKYDNGRYVCPVSTCESGNVAQNEIDARAAEQSVLSVTSLTPNAIGDEREEHTGTDWIMDRFSADPGIKSFKSKFTYDDTAGLYELTIQISDLSGFSKNPINSIILKCPKDFEFQDDVGNKGIIPGSGIDNTISSRVQWHIDSSSGDLFLRNIISSNCSMLKLKFALKGKPDSSYAGQTYEAANDSKKSSYDGSATLALTKVQLRAVSDSVEYPRTEASINKKTP